MSREDWNTYFFEIAQKVATRATCIRRKVGAVAVDIYNRVIATGYNGPPSGFPHCTNETCIRTVQKIPSGTRAELCYAVHAEQNLIVAASDKLINSTVYVTHQPCIICLKMLLAARVKCILWKNPYDDPTSIEMMKKMGVIFEYEDYTIFINRVHNPEYTPDAIKIISKDLIHPTSIDTFTEKEHSNNFLLHKSA